MNWRRILKWAAWAIVLGIVLGLLLATIAEPVYRPFPASMAAAALLRTRPSLLRAAWRAVRIAWLRFEISSAEEWIATCEREGITNTEQLAYQRAHVEALRVRLCIAEASA